MRNWSHHTHAKMERQVDGGWTTYQICRTNTSKFIWKNIIFWFDIPYSLVPENELQFNNKKVTKFCEKLGINKRFSVTHHLWANSQVKTVNKTIKYALKRKFNISKDAWVDELHRVLWKIQTTNSPWQICWSNKPGRSGTPLTSSYSLQRDHKWRVEKWGSQLFSKKGKTSLKSSSLHTNEI